MVAEKDICYNCISEYHERCWNLKYPDDAWCKCPDNKAHNEPLLTRLQKNRFGVA